MFLRWDVLVTLWEWQGVPERPVDCSDIIVESFVSRFTVTDVFLWGPWTPTHSAVWVPGRPSLCR